MLELIVLLIVPFLAVILFELHRFLRLRQSVLKLKSCTPIPVPLCSLAVLGKKASVGRRLFSTEGQRILHNRADFSTKYQGFYVSYDWTWRSCITFSPLPIRLIVADAIIAMPILQESDTWVKPKHGPPMNSIIGQSCTQARGTDATRQRKVLCAALRSPRQFESFVKDAVCNLVTQVSSLLSRANQTNSDGHPLLTHVAVDMQPLLQEASLNFNVWTVFGRDTRGVNDFALQYLAYWDFLRVNVSNLSEKNRQSRMREMEDRIVALKTAMLTLIHNRKAMVSSTTNPCLLDKLMELTIFDGEANTTSDATSSGTSTERLTLEELMHNLYSLITAGFETTAHTLSITLYHLSLAPREQADVAAAAGGGPLIKAVLREALRLHPPVLQMSRVCLVPAAVGAVTCPPGTNVVVDIPGMQRSRVHWGAGADVFDSSRWLTGSGELRTDHKHWMPFGAGRKSCIGQGLAMRAIEGMLAEFVRSFEVQGCCGYVPHFTQTPTLRLANGLWLSLAHRST